MASDKAKEEGMSLFKYSEGRPLVDMPCAGFSATWESAIKSEKQ